METKLCKHCQTEIPKKAKVCPNCKKKQGGIVKWFVIAVIVLFLIGAIGSSEDGSDDNNSVNNTGNVENSNDKNKEEIKEENNDTEETVDNIFAVGEYLETDDLKISYLSCKEYKSDNMYMQPKEGYVYYRLEFEFENLGKRDEFVSCYNFEGYADGYAIDQTYFDDALSATLSSGKKAKGAVYFEVPTDSLEVTAEYEMNFFTEEKVVFVIK